MWTKFKLFIHHILEPHCAGCKFEAAEKRLNERNEIVDEYKEMLASARLEIGRLTQALVDISKPAEIHNQVIESNMQPLKRKMGMHEMAAKLTRESAEMAKELRKTKTIESQELRTDKKTEIDEMEAKLGIN